MVNVKIFNVIQAKQQFIKSLNVQVCVLYKTTWVGKSAENPAGAFIKDDRSQDCFSGQFMSAKFKDKEHTINATSFYTILQKRDIDASSY